MSLRLNPLSVAKGKRYACELCGRNALLACQHCRVTYYCSVDHQRQDWFGIHERICQLLGALRTLRPTLGSEDERQRRNLTVQMSQHALIDLCKNEAHKAMVAGQYELAVPGALQSLRFSMEVYGAGRIELVPAYLLLAESNLGLRRYKVAEEFLLYANWSVLKNPDCSNDLKAQLYRNFGKLYAAQGRFKDALRQLALDVYYSALESGPEHIDTAAGYFYMADVFLTQGEVESALALYDKVVDIWYKFLINLRHRPDESITDYLSEAQIGEAVEMLRSVLETRRQHLGANHIATGEACYALAIIKHVTGFDLDARNHYNQAIEIYTSQLGADNESTQAIVRALNDLPPIPQQLLIKQQAALEAQKQIEAEARRKKEEEERAKAEAAYAEAQAREEAQLLAEAEAAVLAKEAQAASSSSSTAADAAAAPVSSSPPSDPALDSDLQQHFDALKLEHEKATDNENDENVTEGNAEADAEADTEAQDEAEDAAAEGEAEANAEAEADAEDATANADDNAEVDAQAEADEGENTQADDQARDEQDANAATNNDEAAE